MNVFLDIGFTLLGGPELSPPKMIAKILNLEKSFLDRLSGIVFAQYHTDPRSLANSLEKCVGREIDRRERNLIVDFWKGQYEEAYELDWAHGFMEALIGAGIDIHIVSNLWFPFYDRFRQIFSSIRPFIKSETLSFREGVKKPSPEFYRIAFQRSGAEPSDSFSVGDSLGNDILPYADSGMKCVWYASRPLSEDKLAASDAILSKYGNIYKVCNLGQAFEILTRENAETYRGPKK